MEREAGPADKGSFSHSRSTSFFLCHNATELSISNHRQVASRLALWHLQVFDSLRIARKYRRDALIRSRRYFISFQNTYRLVHCSLVDR